MGSPVRRNLTVRRGDVFREHVAWITPQGRHLDDLAITASATGVTSADGFESSDSGQAITAVDGSGITDGTTLLVTGATSGSLSASATATRVGVVATIGGADMSAFTNHLAQIRASQDATSSVAFTIDDSRADVGVFTLSIASAATEAMTAGGVWDWQADGPNGTVTLMEGSVRFVKDTARP